MEVNYTDEKENKNGFLIDKKTLNEIPLKNIEF